jgi:acyl-CoA thioester hydrolase
LRSGTTSGAGHPVVTTVRVRYPETDPMGVVYHAHYLVWCDIGRTEFIRRLGTSYAEIERAGVVLAVVEASVRYAASARYDDLVAITTTLARIRSREIQFDYVIERANEPRDRLATAFVRLIPLAREGTPMRFPDHLLRMFGNVLLPEDR